MASVTPRRAVHTPAKMASVPNQPKTPHLTIRAPRELQDAVKAKAADEGTTVTAVVIAALEEYVADRDA